MTSSGMNTVDLIESQSEVGKNQLRHRRRKADFNRKLQKSNGQPKIPSLLNKSLVQPRMGAF